MKQKMEMLKALLKNGFSPLEISKEGKLRGGSNEVVPNGNCGDCNCPPKNDVCPINSKKCPFTGNL